MSDEIHIPLPDDFNVKLLREEAEQLLTLLESMSAASPTNEALSYAAALAFNVALAVGVKVSKSNQSQRLAADKSANDRKNTAQDRYAKWQRDADEFKGNHRSASKRRVAMALADKYFREDSEVISPNTIRQKISWPKKP